MPSPGEDYQSWSVTAASNGSADPSITWVEGQTRASVNNSSRSELAAHAKNRNLLNGSIVTFGTANAQQFLSGVSYTAVPTGLVVKLKIGAGLTNAVGTPTTLNMDSIGAVEIQTADGISLKGNELIAGAYVDLLYNGTNWIFLYSREFIQFELDGGGGVIIGHQVFSTAGTFVYTPTQGMECCIIECIGGGGAGGTAGATSGEYLVAAGGGSGGYSRKQATVADIGTSQVVTVGAGGPGGFDNGQPGASSSLGSLCVALGGGGGTFHTTASNSVPGDGAALGTGDITAAGTPGLPGYRNISAATVFIFNSAGQGGTGPFGGGGTVADGPGGGGHPGRNYGGGGAGGSSYNAGGTGLGAAGAAGCVIITEFAGRGAPGRDGDQGPIGPTGPSGPGTGDVLRTGTPTAGQIAKWTDASHIQGVTVAGPQITVLTSGSGTFTTPAGAIWLEVEMNGGGGGGNNGDNGNAGAAGTGSTFGGSLATGGGGLSGGSATGGDINITGGSKPVIGGRSDGTLTTPGANGANSPFCGAGGGGGFGYAAGLAASANSGSGGGGGSVIAAGGFGGLGGSAGGYLRKLITSPLATYAYTVGAGGNGGAETSGCWAGGNGGSGVIIVTAHFGA